MCLLDEFDELNFGFLVDNSLRYFSNVAALGLLFLSAVRLVAQAGLVDDFA